MTRLTLTRAAGPYGAIENFGRLDISGSRLENNATSNSGGAILNHAELHLSNIVFTNNSANNLGGGIYTDGGSTTLERGSFTGNLAVNGGGAVALASGAQLDIGASEFSVNKTSATLAEGGAVNSAGNLQPVAGSRFAQNDASRGGAISVVAGAASVGSSSFTGNWATYGGSIRLTLPAHSP